MMIKTSMFGVKHKVINIRRVKELLNELLSKEENIDIVVLPEEFYSGSTYNFTNVPIDINDLESGLFKEFGEIAKKYSCHIVGEITANVKNINSTDKRYSNLGFVIGRNGEIMGYQERFHTYPEESEFIKQGLTYKVFDLDIGRVGLVPGMDIFYPEVARNLALKGAEILITPGLIPKLDDEPKTSELLTNMARQSAISSAMQNQVFFIYVNGVGESVHVEGEFVGNSIVAGPLGTVKSFGCGEKLDVVEINKKDIDEVKEIISIMDLRNKVACAIAEK